MEYSQVNIIFFEVSYFIDFVNIDRLGEEEGACSGALLLVSLVYV